VAPAQSKRQSRKRRRSAQAEQAEITPERVQAEIARQRAARQAAKTAPAEDRGRRSSGAPGAVRTTLTGKTYGDPPPSPFGDFPASEIAILAGAVGVVVGLLADEALALVVGVIVCTVGVLEVTAREHLSGYRSHATLLAGIPAVAIGVGLIALFGDSLTRSVLLLVVVPVFGVLFWLLRKRFGAARQARVVKPPAP
jgi:hypothetical protein